MEHDHILKTLEQHPELKSDLFIRGFLITDSSEIQTEAHPFYGTWVSKKVGDFQIISHPLTGCHLYQKENGCTYFLMGHAYNPFTMQHEESVILQHIAEAQNEDEELSRINDLTGVFVMGKITNGKVSFLVDPSGMQSAFCGCIKGKTYITSHAQLVGDICNLQMDAFVRELTAYKWYGRVMGPYLPGDLSPFSELKRIVPSHLYQISQATVSHTRFWPIKEHTMATEKADYDKVIAEAADILRNGMTLITKKWNNPWISLTGGIDSNTTFAAANGNYDKYQSFSYISAEKEIRDAEAAKKIASRFNVKHNLYQIPDNNDAIDGFDAILEVLTHNNAYVAKLLPHEARKRIILRRNAGCDVEVKSWVSETIRCYWYKHYGRSNMPKLSAKLFRNLYKIFIANRPLAHKIDRIFADYIKEYEYENIPSCFPPADMHYNEVTWGSWGGLNISEMKYCFDITFCYNNRRFLDILFRVPMDKRISDQHHLDMKAYLNKELFDMGIRVVNMKETNFRARALNVIFTMNQLLPF